MSINCRVFRDEKGNISFVNAPNGKKSILFNKLVDMLGGNKNAALNIYALTETEDFKDIVDSKKSEYKAKVLSNIDLGVTEKEPELSQTVEDIKNPIDYLSEEDKKTLLDEYGKFYSFDWNTESQRPDFEQWLEDYKNEKLIENLDKLIQETNEDISLKEQRDLADKKLSNFEELIIPVIGNSILIPELSAFTEQALLDSDATTQSIEEAFREAKNIIDKDGSLNKLKITPPSFIEGKSISLPGFEKFVEENPDYKKVFEDWKKLLDESTNLTIKNTNAFRESTPISKIKSLRDSLVSINSIINPISKEQPYKEELSINNTGKTQKFFSDVVSGISEKYKAKKKWTPLLTYTEAQKEFNNVYSRFKGNFDNHIATSIPTFRETQVKVGNALLEMLPEGSLIYDIGGSEGGLVKAITSLSKGGIESINLDVNEDMGAAHNAVPVEGSTFVNEAFYQEYTDEDTGKTYKKHIPENKADVVHESMVFQFITPERQQFIKEIKNNYLKNDGIVLLEEKLVPSTDKEWLQNEALKDKYKLQYYTQEEISGKSEEVLAGMRKNQTAVQELLKSLKSEFKYVEQYWEAGNFKGFIATDSREKLNTFMKKLGGKVEFKEDLVSPSVKDTPTMQYKGAKLYTKDRINPFSGKPTGEIELDLIKTDERERGQGQAKELLQRFSDYADALGKSAYLAVSPFDKTIDAERLKGLYSAFGFKSISDFEMVRKPKPIRPEGFDTNGEPDVNTLLTFSNSTLDMLSPEELIEAKNTLIGFGVKNSQELKNILEKNFIKNGVISFNESILEANGNYNKYEISQILKSSEIQRGIKNSIAKLKNMNYFSVEYDINFANPSSSELNIFGKQVYGNPFIIEKELAVDLAGEALENVRDFLPESLVNQYDNNSEFKAAIDSLATDYRNVPAKKILDNEIVDQEDSIEGMLKRTLSDDFNENLANEVAYLNGISPEMWEDSKVIISNILSGVEREASKNGIDLRDFSTKAITKSREQILQFLDEMENMLEEQSDENIKYFSDSYNNLFEKDKTTTQLAKTNSEFDIYLDTDLSEYELFSKFGLIKNTQNIYRETEDTSLDELYSNFFSRKSLFPSDITNIEDLKEYVQKNTPKLEVSDFQVDSDNLEKMFLYKTFFNFPMSSKEELVSIDEAILITFDPAFLQDDFVKETAKWIIDTNNSFFKVTEKGIELVETDQISKEEAILTIPESMIEKFSEYDKISNNLNLGLQLQEENYPVFDQESLDRLYAINNPESVPKAKGEYSYVEGGILATKNEHNNFVRTPIGIYEMIYQMGNLKFFNKLEEANASYKTIEAVKPLSDIDFSKYLYLETSPEVFKESKEYYTKKELKQINDDYFGCQ